MRAKVKATKKDDGKAEEVEGSGPRGPAWREGISKEGAPLSLLSTISRPFRRIQEGFRVEGTPDLAERLRRWTRPRERRLKLARKLLVSMERWVERSLFQQTKGKHLMTISIFRFSSALLGLAMGGSLLISSPAGAQTPPAAANTGFVKAEAEAVEDGKVHGSITGQVGVLFTAGNSSTLALSSGANLELKKLKNRFRFEFVGNVAAGDANLDGKFDFSGDDSEVSGLFLGANTRYDRFVVPGASLYILGGAFHDPFQHLTVRPHVQLGVSKEIVKNDKHLLVGEVGADYAMEMYGYYDSLKYNPDGVAAPGTNPTHIISGRLYLKYGLTLAPNLLFSQEVEGLPGGTTDPERRFSARLNSITALNVQITKGVGLKFGLTGAFNFTPPEGTKPYDIATTVNLVAGQAF